jgi:hypothetical protein
MCQRSAMKCAKIHITNDIKTKTSSYLGRYPDEEQSYTRTLSSSWTVPLFHHHPFLSYLTDRESVICCSSAAPVEPVSHGTSKHGNTNGPRYDSKHMGVGVNSPSKTSYHCGSNRNNENRRLESVSCLLPICKRRKGTAFYNTGSEQNDWRRIENEGEISRIEGHLA